MDTVQTQGYSCKMVDQYETSRGIAWNAELRMGEIKIGHIENRGDGGQTRVEINDGAYRRGYVAAAIRACPDSGEAPSRFAELLADVADGMAVAI